MTTTPVQQRYQRDLEVVLAAPPAGGWPDPNKFTTPAVVTLPQREGPYMIKVVSGNVTIASTISSAQDVFDASAVWEDWPHGAVIGPFPTDVLEDAEAIRITATADAIVQVLGVRS